MSLNFSTKKSTMPMSRILTNTCISTKRRNQAKRNENSGTKRTTMETMIKKNMKMRRKSGQDI